MTNLFSKLYFLIKSLLLILLNISPEIPLGTYFILFLETPYLTIHLCCSGLTCITESYSLLIKNSLNTIIPLKKLSKRLYFGNAIKGPWGVLTYLVLLNFFKKTMKSCHRNPKLWT